jgi:hypothetical protein
MGGKCWAPYRVYLAVQTDLVQVFKGIFIVFFVVAAQTATVGRALSNARSDKGAAAE